MAPITVRDGLGLLIPWVILMLSDMCSEKARLLIDYDAAHASHGARVGALRLAAGTMEVEDYRAALDHIDLAAEALARARGLLAEHVADHGC